MTHLETVLKLVKEQEVEDTVRWLNRKVNNYKEYLEIVYNGNGKAIKEDITYILKVHNKLDFVNDNLDVVDENGNIISYAKWMNILKKEIWG